MSQTANFSFGPLIGVIQISNTQCRFLVYVTKNAELLTFHELKLRQIIHNTGWLEYDPSEIWKQILECIEAVQKSLNYLGINSCDIAAVSIVNQRGAVVVWSKNSGEKLYNAIGWTDSRSTPILKTLLNNVNQNADYLRSSTGLPLSTCFSALKLVWLRDNVPAIAQAIEEETCLIGTLDTWLLWNLTGAVQGGVHSTDVTNAHYTALLNIHSLEWDPKVCQFFRLPLSLLPQVRSNSEIYGHVIGTFLDGVPIAGVIGDQPAALLGQLSTRASQNVCNIDDSCFVLLNTGKILIPSEHGLITGIAHKLGKNSAAHYTLEGAISNAGSTVQWLKDQLHISTDITANGNVVDSLNSFIGESSLMSSCSSGILNVEGGLAAKRCDITLVPAFNGIYAPYWRYDSRGILLGINSQTTSENVTQAAYEATGFQIHEILEAFEKDIQSFKYLTMPKKLTIGGEYSENKAFIQFVSDILGRQLERPQTISAFGIGAMMVAGITMRLITLDYALQTYRPPNEEYSPMTTFKRRHLLYERWKYAVNRCLQWNNFATFEADLELFAQRERDPNAHIRCSLPGTIFLTSCFAFLLISRFLNE